MHAFNKKGAHVNSSQLTSLCHDSVHQLCKIILMMFQPVTLAFIRFEVIQS